MGHILLANEDNLSPLKWKLGRVNKVFSGPGGNVRLVELKKQVGDCKSPISKVYPLPL